VNLLREYVRRLVEEDKLEEKRTVAPSSIIYCDMDGVLVDFETGTVELLNRLLDDPQALDSTAGKTYHKTLRKLHNELGTEWRLRGRPDMNIKPVRNFMFAVISENPGKFFGSLSPLADGVGELWSFLNSTGHAVKLLTAGVPGRQEAPTSEQGKKMWAVENLSPPPEDVILRPAAQKVEFATSAGVPNVLIDDKVSTVQAWNDAKGIGVLHIPGGSSATIARLQELGL